MEVVVVSFSDTKKNLSICQCAKNPFICIMSHNDMAEISSFASNVQKNLKIQQRLTSMAKSSLNLLKTNLLLASCTR